jgi:hypothetical protein
MVLEYVNGGELFDKIVRILLPSASGTNEASFNKAFTYISNTHFDAW